MSEGPGAGTWQTLAPVPGTEARVLMTLQSVIIILIMVIIIMTYKVTRARDQRQLAASLQEEGSEMKCQLLFLTKSNNIDLNKRCWNARNF